MGNLASEPETRFWKRFYTNVTINQHTTHIEDIEDTSPMSPLALASDACAGGIIFWSGLSLAQVMQKCLRVSSATPILPQVIGCISIACLSTASVWYAALPRKLLLDYNKSTSDQWKKITTLYEYMTAFYHMRMQTTSLSMHPIYCLMGFIIFRVLGGRMLAIAPSDYRFLGAFHRFESSASATQMYAGDKIRLMMQSFGRRTGCHTCGSRRHSLYHADHMPPNEFAKRDNAGLMNRWLGRTVRQRYYPQCQTCSNIQGPLVKQTGSNRWSRASKLQSHWKEFRAYHLTGFWLVLFVSIPSTTKSLQPSS